MSRESAAIGIRPEDRETAADPADRMEIRMWLRLLTCTKLIEQELRGMLSQRFQTTLPRFDALAQLERASEGLTMGQLSARMMVSGGNVTGVVNRLESDGWVERVAAAGDRRRNIVRLTPSGEALFEEMANEHHRYLHTLLGDLDPSAVEALFDQLRELKASIRTNAKDTP